MTRAKALLLTLAVFVLGGVGYWGFAAAGFEEFDAGIAASVVLLVLVLGWTATYLTRVVTGKMTFMEQRRRYRSAYDAMEPRRCARSSTASAQRSRRPCSKRWVSWRNRLRHSNPCPLP